MKMSKYTRGPLTKILKVKNDGECPFSTIFEER